MMSRKTRRKHDLATKQDKPPRMPPSDRNVRLNNIILREGDRVFYVGQKFKQELSKEGKPTVGWIHARVEGNPRAFVVEFESKNWDSYVMDVSVLSKVSPKVEKELVGPEVQPRRKKATEEEQ